MWLNQRLPHPACTFRSVSYNGAVEAKARVRAHSAPDSGRARRCIDDHARVISADHQHWLRSGPINACNWGNILRESTELGRNLFLVSNTIAPRISKRYLSKIGCFTARARDCHGDIPTCHMQAPTALPVVCRLFDACHAMPAWITYWHPSVPLGPRQLSRQACRQSIPRALGVSFLLRPGAGRIPFGDARPRLVLGGSAAQHC